MLPARMRSALAVSALLFAGSAGCGPGAARVRSQQPTDVVALASKAPSPPDLSAPFSGLAWMQSTTARSPLAVASMLASSAGGDWIAVAPKRVDNIKWNPLGRNRNRIYTSLGHSHDDMAGGRVGECLKAIQRAGDKLAWESANGRVTLFFGTNDDLGAARAHPPETVTGVYVQSRTCAGMLASIAEFWKLKIDADPALLARRDLLLRARRQSEPESESRGVLGAMSSMYRYGMMGRRSKRSTELLSLTVEEKTGPESLLRRAAAMMAGECEKTESGWSIIPLKPGKNIQAEIARLRKVIETKSGTDYIHSSPNPYGYGDAVVVLGEVADEPNQAIETLVTMGPPAHAALDELLTVTRASLARAVLRGLVAVGGESELELALKFGRRLQKALPKETKLQHARSLLLGEVVRALSKKPERAAARWLAEASRDTRIPADLRFLSRTALGTNGGLALIRSGLATTVTSRVTDFRLSTSPNGKPTSEIEGAIKPSATCRDSSGNIWAVFTSGRCGESNDFWLARSERGAWVEFLFTGLSFGGDQRFGGPWGSRPSVQARLSIKVDARKVTLGPPSGEKDDPLIPRLLAQARARNISAKRRNQLMQKYHNRQQAQWQRRMGQLQEVLTCKLADIRKDSDSDGLTDLVEKRLKTDPARRDTDGDGKPDGVDANPLAAPQNALTERQRIAQAIFTALFAGDPNDEPILVILERRDWMEFTGSRSVALCVTREDYIERRKTLGSLRALQFGGPGPTGSTVLRVDGPVAFNDDRTRAEVRFWQWNGRVSTSDPWALIYGGLGAAAPTDYVALFSRRGASWRIDSLKPWQAVTAETTVADILRKQMEEAYNP